MRAVALMPRLQFACTGDLFGVHVALKIGSVVFVSNEIHDWKERTDTDIMRTPSTRVVADKACTHRLTSMTFT